MRSFSVRTPLLAGVLGALAALAACSKTPPANQTTEATSPAKPATASGSAQAATVASASGAAQVAPAPPPKPAGPPSDLNVILISIDSLRADMPWAGYPRDIAPRLTALEKTAVSYTHAYSVSSYTSMSLGGLLGGKLPSELKRDGWFFGTYHQENLFFPELLQRAKIRTMAVQAHFYFKPGTGFEQGFDKWEIVPGIKSDNTTDQNITSPQSEQIMERLLSDPANDDNRFFAWAHFLDPHDMYMKHDGISYGKSARDLYDGEVTYTDQHIAKLLDFIATKPWASRTAIIVTSDHGEAFGEHGQTRHGFEIWENLVRVPMFFLFPGAEAKHIDQNRSALDLAPTILDLFGVAPDPSFEGTSLVKEIYGTQKPEPRDVYVDLPATSNNDKRRALIRGTDKLTCYSNDNICKVFDLAADPTEDHPITSGDKLKELHGAYKAHVKELKEVPAYSCGPDCLNNAYLNRKKPE